MKFIAYKKLIDSQSYCSFFCLFLHFEIMDNTHQAREKKHLTTTEKWAVVADYILYLDQERMRLIDGARKIIEEEFHVVDDHSTRLINRYWTQ